MGYYVFVSIPTIKNDIAIYTYTIDYNIRVQLHMQCTHLHMYIIRTTYL